MTLEIIAACVVGLVLGFFILRFMLLFLYPNHFRLKVNKRALTVDEQSFLKCLERALGDEYYIMPHVRLLDISHFQGKVGFFQKYVVNKRIGEMYADFTLCKKTDLSILGVVELEKFSKTTTLKQKAKREKLLASVCRQIDVKLFYFDGRQDYSGMDVRRLITGKTRRAKQKKVVVAEEASAVSVEKSSMMKVEEVEKIRSCPKCYSEVVTKIAVKGDNIGEKFLMCRKFPYCDYNISVKDALVEEMKLKEKESVSKAGYRNFT